MTDKFTAGAQAQIRAVRRRLSNVDIDAGVAHDDSKGPPTFTTHLSFSDVYRADPLKRVSLIKNGLPPAFLVALSDRMNMPKDRLMSALGIPYATVSRKTREAKKMSSDHSERALGMARLVGQVEAMIQDSGDGQAFDAALWVAHWLEQPLPALDGQRPADLIDSAEGQAIVSNLLARMQSGAYA